MMEEDIMNEIQQSKGTFVEEHLFPFLQAMDERIDTAAYHVVKSTSMDLEYVLITWKDGQSRRIYVTATNLIAMSRDILRAL